MPGPETGSPGAQLQDDPGRLTKEWARPGTWGGHSVRLLEGDGGAPAVPNPTAPHAPPVSTEEANRASVSVESGLNSERTGPVF